MIARRVIMLVLLATASGLTAACGSAASPSCTGAACVPDAPLPDGPVGQPDAGAAADARAAVDGGAACAEHAQCATSNVCLPDGTCADPAQVAYVDPAGSDNPDCSKTSPCTKVMSALASNRPYVKLHGTIDEAVTINRDVTLLADPGTTLTTTGGDVRGVPILSVAGQENGVLRPIRVGIYDLEVTGAHGPFFGYGIEQVNSHDTIELHRSKVTNNANGGIVGNGGTLTVTDSTVSGNGLTGTAAVSYGENSGIYVMETTLTVSRSTLDGNRTFGVYLFGHGTTTSRLILSGNKISGNGSGGLDVLNAVSVNIVDNFFFANGSGSSSAGGLIVEGLMTSEPETSLLELNSFNQNLAKDGAGTAIQCATGVTLAARSNILSENGTSSNHEQVGGPCTHSYSIVQPGTLPPGMGNLAMDPRFKSATGDLHIQAGSPAAGAADPSSELTGLAAQDIDGDPRMAPADIGADEIP